MHCGTDHTYVNKTCTDIIQCNALILTGSGKPSPLQELSSCVVETVTKTTVMSRFAGIQKFASEAGNVVCEGNGLKKAFRGKQSTFTIDTSMGGTYVF